MLFDKPINHDSLTVGNGLGNPAKKALASCVEHIQRIAIDVQLAGVKIADSFEWDLSNPDNSPEEFASMIVSDHLLEKGIVKSREDVA